MPRYGLDFFDGQLEAVKGLVQAVGHEAAIVRFRDPFGSLVGMGKKQRKRLAEQIASWRGTLTQYAGRLHRLNAAKKDVIIYDYVDWQVPVLAKMHVRRRTEYKAIGYEIALPENKSQAVQLALENL